MTIDSISQEVKQLKRLYHETDPFQMCSALGIKVLYSPMGIGVKCCKGFFLTQSRKRSITINSDMAPIMQRVIAAHELGHAVLHTKASGIKAFHDFALFDSTSAMEYEANLFAADYLMEDSDVLELLNDDLSFFGAAAKLNVPAELLDFKFRVLKRKGYQMVDSPLMANGDFLKNIDAKADDLEIC